MSSPMSQSSISNTNGNISMNQAHTKKIGSLLEHRNANSSGKRRQGGRPERKKSQAKNRRDAAEVHQHQHFE